MIVSAIRSNRVFDLGEMLSCVLALIKFLPKSNALNTRIACQDFCKCTDEVRARDLCARFRLLDRENA